jgi:hypothetical protein
MTNNNNVEILLQKHYERAVGYCELSLFEDAERELDQIRPEVAAQSVPVLALRLQICVCLSRWKEVRKIARRLYLIDAFNPTWPYCEGFSTAKIQAADEKR